MFDFHPTVTKQGVRAEKGARSHIIGQSDSSTLLYSVNTLSHTIIEQVNSDGSSITVISFKGYMDFISASISSDKMLLHLTERIPEETGFVFSSYIVNIQTCAKSAPIQSNDTVTAFFIPQKQDNNYQIIHITGSTIAHLTVKVSKNEVKLQRLRGGINFHDTLWWKYDIKNYLLSVIHKYDNAMVLTEFIFAKGSTTTLPMMPFPILEEQILPPELSFQPVSLSHLPYYEFTNKRIFMSHYKSKTLLIQQVTSKEPNKLAFFVSVYPNNFNDYITIDVVNTEIPINFYHCGECAIVFSPNIFMCFVNFTRGAPSTHIYYETEPNPAQISDNCQTIRNTNLIIDMTNGNVYDVCPRIDKLISRIAESTNKDFKSIALFAQRQCTKENIISLFNALMTNWDKKLALDTLTHFFVCAMHSIKHENIQFGSAPMFVPHHTPIQTINTREFLEKADLKSFLRSQKVIDKISPLLNDIVSNHPSATGKPTRQQIFFLLTQSSINRKSRPTDECAMSALRKMERQNAIVTTLRIALNEWREVSKPAPAVYFCIIRIIQFITIHHFWPAVVGIDKEIYEMRNEDDVRDAASHMEFILHDGRRKSVEIKEDLDSAELQTIDDHFIENYDV